MLLKDLCHSGILEKFRQDLGSIRRERGLLVRADGFDGALEYVSVAIERSKRQFQKM